MIDQDSIFLAKARESLAGAESEFVNGRYNNCANRCYYACFHAAVHALEELAIRPRADAWSHEGLQATFVGELINRRKVYPAELRDVLMRTQALRNTADYEPHWVTETQATRALRRTRTFVEALEGGGTR
jgi:uncharacterized protein (UPF0332 family)